MRQITFAILLFLCATSVFAGHSKTDIATIDDGSTLVGEILKVQYATLTLKTDAVGTLNIEWRRITGLTSEYEYQVELSDGSRHYGTLEPATEVNHLKVVSADNAIEVRLSDVVKLSPIENDFFDRLNGSLTFGLTYTQANEVFQYNLGFDANYRSRKNYGTLTASSIFNTQSNADSTQQSDIQLLLAQVSKYKWGPFELAALQSNPAQGYDIRTLLGGGASRFIIENSAYLFALNLGAVYNREEVTESDEVNNTAEILTGIAFRHYKASSYSPGIETSLNIFTDLNIEDRYRAAFRFNIAWKIIQDYTFNFRVDDSYDTNPPGVDANKNNISIVTSIGHTF